MKILLSPHNDDEALFCSFTILREKPLVIIVTESHRQAQRGGLPHIRRAETVKAMALLGAPVVFLGIPDDRLTADLLCQRLAHFTDVEKVWAPAFYLNGNPDHNAVSKAADILWGEKVICYSTYRLDDLEPQGTTEITPTEEEAAIKDAALNCYASQLVLTPEHFAAVRGKSEYYVA